MKMWEYWNLEGMIQALLRIYCVGHVPHVNRLNDVVFCKLHNLKLLNKVCVFLHHQVDIIAWSVNVCKMLWLYSGDSMAHPSEGMCWLMLCTLSYIWDYYKLKKEQSLVLQPFWDHFRILNQCLTYKFSHTRHVCVIMPKKVFLHTVGHPISDT